MSDFKRHSTLRNPTHDNSESRKPRKPTKFAATKAPLSKNRMLVICFLPVWLALVLVFDMAIADYHERSVPLTVRVVASPNKQDLDQVEDALRTHWVNTDDEGNLFGRISKIDDEQSIITPIGELKVVLLQNGMVQRQVEATNSDGQFTLDKVEPGDYTLVASGSRGFLAYAVHVLTPLVEEAPGDDARSKPQPAAGRHYVSLSDTAAADVGNQGDLNIDCAAIPPAFVELEKIVSGFLPTNAGLVRDEAAGNKPFDNALEIAGGFKYPLDADGSLTGRVLPLSGDEDKLELSDMNVFLLQDDIEIHRVDVEDNGDFQIEDVEPGVYAVVAAGKSGFAALSIELVLSDEEQSAIERGTSEVYVSLAEEPAKLPLTVAIVTDPDDLQYVRQVVSDLNLNAANPNAPAEGGLASSFEAPTISGGIPGSPGGAPGSFGGPPGSPGPSGSPSRFSGRGGRFGFTGDNGGLSRFLRGSAIAAAIVALGNIDSNPTTASPMQTQ